uniref:Transmembrane protein 54a n=1 Tax=Neolamprologus brichardi TaxID=32507 RepID=A0A3Q4GTP7_NEOBR
MRHISDHGVTVCTAQIRYFQIRSGSLSYVDNKVLMKMGLALVLVGHVNFILGALVHGTVLRHISLQHHSNCTNSVFVVLFLQICVLLVFSFIAGFLASASTASLLLSVITAIMSKGKALLTQCNETVQNISSFSITNECPFDPTRIYATTIILWLPLIFTSVVEAAFSFRCFAVCTSLLYLCPCRKRPRVKNRVSYSQIIVSSVSVTLLIRVTL